MNQEVGRASRPTMWNNRTCYYNQVSQPSTPRAASSPSMAYGQKALSPRIRFPHVYPHLLVPTLHQLPPSPSPRSSYYANRACSSPVYAFPYYMSNMCPLGSGGSSPSRVIPPSPHGAVYSPRIFIGKRFGLVPATPRPAAVEDLRPLPVAELVGDLSLSCNETITRTRGICCGPEDEEASLKMERFKIRTVDIDEVLVVQGDDHHKPVNI